MAFKGDLKNISLFDVLQTLHQNKQTGVLVVQRGSVTRKIFIDQGGVRVFFTRSSRPLRLGEIFVRRGRITAQDVEILLLQQKQSYRAMGELLVESGKVKQAEVDQVLFYHAEDEIYDIFSWDSGTFSFYDGQTAEEHASTPLSDILLDPAGLCLEAARRLDEIERLREVVPSNDCYVVRAEGFELDREQSSKQVCEIFDVLDVPYSINDLRDLAGLSLYEVLKAVAQLIEGELVRSLTAPELTEVARNARSAGEFERAAQMFEEAHQLDPLNREVLDECIEAVQRLDQPKRLSALLGAMGRLAMAEGRHEDAIEYLEQALRQASDKRETLAALREAFAELGDVDRTAEISLKIARSFADDGNIEQAVNACRWGLEVAPDSIALRYHLCQLLVRAELVPQAQQALWALINDTESSATLMRSKKAHDLLRNCYRLLLKLDPRDEEAHHGLRHINRQHESSARKHRLLIRSAIAAGALLIVGVIGIAIAGPSAGSMLEEIEAALQRRDPQAVHELVSRIVEAFPNAEETQRALAIRHSMDTERRSAEAARRKREAAAKAEFDEAWSEVRGALDNQPYVEALSLVRPYLERLNKPQAAIIRPALKAHFEYEFGAFLERVVKQFNDDRQHVALSESQLRKSVNSIESLGELEKKLERVRARNWAKLMPQMLEFLDQIAAAPQAGKAKDSIERFRKVISRSYGAFADLDTFYYTVRRKRLRLQITDAVMVARKQRLELLRRCEFAKARGLYDIAFRKADGVTDEEPREHFRELIEWLDKANIRSDMRKKRDEIDGVVSALAEIESLRAAGKTAAAYRRFRPLVVEYPVIQFERKYKMPYLIRSTPTGAEVLINGESVGQAPVAVRIDIVKRTQVVVRREGFADATVSLMATDPSLNGELDVRLQKRTSWGLTVSGRVEARPVIARVGKTLLLLVATSNADLVAIGVAKGEVRWTAETRLLDRITAAPVVDGENAYLLTAGGLLYRIRLSDGHVQGERLRLPGPVNHDAAFDGKTLYVATQNRRLVAVREGTIVYDKPLARAPSTRLLFADGSLLVGSAEGEILVHDAATGGEQRRMRARGETSFLGGIGVHKSLLVAGAEDGALYAFDRKTGESRWRYETGEPVTALPVSDGTNIYLPARDGYVHAIDEAGKRTLRYELRGSSEHAPVLSGEFLYAVGGGHVSAFNTANEMPWWEFTFKAGDGVPEYVIAGADTVMVVTSNSRIVAFPQDER